MTRHRPLTAIEIDQLDELGLIWRRARATPDRERTLLRLVAEATRLNADMCAWAHIARHLRLTPSQLRRLRNIKTVTPEAPDDRAVIPVRLTLPDQTSALGSTSAVIVTSEAFHANSVSSSNSLAGESTASTFLAGTSHNGVFVALGIAGTTPGASQRADLNKEAKTIERSLPSHRPPRISVDTTPGDLQDLALQQPFILHLATHREMGATMLADMDGHRLPVMDEDLVRLLAPEEGAPAVLMLSFCDSHEVATRLYGRDIAVVSFIGEVLDEGALAFYRHLYDALRLGRSIRLAFEVGYSMRRAYGLEPRLNPHSSAHDRPLPM